MRFGFSSFGCATRSRKINSIVIEKNDDGPFAVILHEGRAARVGWRYCGRARQKTAMTLSGPRAGIARLLRIESPT